MKRLLLCVVFAVIAFSASDLLACETCRYPGTYTEDGVTITITRTTCWASCKGESAWCFVKEDYSGCNRGDEFNACPDCAAGGGSGDGGTGGGDTGSGGSCAGGGYCPPECMRCGDVGNGGIRI